MHPGNIEIKSAANRESVRGELEARRADLLEQKNEAMQALQTRPGQNPDRGSLAQSYASRQRQEAFRIKLEEQLAQIENALARLEAGTYNQCQNCREQIGRERQRALPQATYCIRCQTQKETHL